MKRRLLCFLTMCVLVMSVCINPVMASDAEYESDDTEETSTEEQSEDEIAAGKFIDAVRAIVLAKAGEGKSRTQAATAIYQTLTDSQLWLVYGATDVPLYGSGYYDSEDTDDSGDSDTETGSDSDDEDVAGPTIDVMETYNSALLAYEEDRKFRSGDGWYIVLESGDVTYYRVAGPSTVRNAYVPRQVIKNGFVFKVAEVSPFAFKDCRHLETVVIHKTVKHIGRYAFKNTPQLRTIKIMGRYLRKGSVKNAFADAGSGGGKYTGSNLVVKVPKEYIEYYNTLFKKEGALHKKAVLRKY